MSKDREFDKFNKVMDGLLAVPYSELQKKLEDEKRDKAAHKKKKRSTSTASSRASMHGRKKPVA
jgi:hypothetical protein